MNDNPLVSILLLSMNHNNFIEQCINSLRKQTYKNLEIIYLDNASKDGTFETAISLLKGSGFTFKAFQNKHSKSISKNLNFLFAQSSGEYISPMSSDDWFEKENIEEKINFFLKHQEIGALFSNGWIYDELTKTILLNDGSNFSKGHIYKEILTQPDSMFYVGVIYKRKVLEDVGNWDENLLIEDVDMYVRIAQKYTIDFIDKPLVYYRRTKTSASKNKAFMLQGYNQYYQKYKKADWIDMKKWLSERYRSFAAKCLDENNNREAANLLKQAFKLNPFEFKNFQTLLYFLKSSFIVKT